MKIQYFILLFLICSVFKFNYVVAQRKQKGNGKSSLSKGTGTSSKGSKSKKGGANKSQQAALNAWADALTPQDYQYNDWKSPSNGKLVIHLPYRT
jgi:hypothetical protein